MDFVTENLVNVLDALLGSSIRYEMNGMVGKVRDLEGTEPSAITQLDCSGFVEYVIYKSTLHNTTYPQAAERSVTKLR